MEDRLREKTNYKFKVIKEFYKAKSSIREFAKEKDLKKKRNAFCNPKYSI